ncbi:MAG: hypothetical protein R3C19_12415 [Planctomycetaceae bacterium]
MSDAPQFDTISVLIPGYSIEDMPRDLDEPQAAALLNAIAVAWHPRLIEMARGIPDFRQADFADGPKTPQILIVPSVSEDRPAHDWRQQYEACGALVVSGCTERDEWLAAVESQAAGILGPESAPATLDGDLVADFLALGTCHFLVLLMSRRLHHYVEPNQHLLRTEVQAAAESLLKGEVEQTGVHLKRAFECLLNAREQFHPVECFLLDVCLPSTETTADDLCTLLETSGPLNLCCSVGELTERLEGGDRSAEALHSPIQRLATKLRTAIEAQQASLLTGHRFELRTVLGSLATLYDDLRFGQTELLRQIGTLPANWARRRFGMVHSLPAVLSLFGYQSALHVALDDGVYPDRERGQVLWQGPDGSQVMASSRIPVAIDSSSAFLRFADRYAESMQEDNTAVMLLARLPSLQNPWLTDLKRIERYAPVLGSFTTFDDFISGSGAGANSVQYSAGEYLGPTLIQSSVLKTESPISSPAELFTARARLESFAAMSAMSAVLQPRTHQPDAGIDELALAIMEEESRRADGETSRTAEEQAQSAAEISRRLDELGQQIAEDTCRRLPRTCVHRRGLVILNPLPYSRHHALTWPADLKLPAASDACRQAYEQSGTTILNLNLPACGFVWLTEADGSVPPISRQSSDKGSPLAEDYLLRNRFFEVLINEATGGVGEVRFHGKRGNRLSQQAGFRYENGRKVEVDGEQLSVSYATTRMVSLTVRQAGPWLGEIQTVSDICDPATGSVLARVTQTTAVERDFPRLHIGLQFDNVVHEPNGNPWMTYYGCRFAWDNEAASVTRSVLGQAAGFRSERFESPDYIEVADSDYRLLIVPHGRPYHRRSGPRMLDSLLMVEGEQTRRFRFTIEFDQPFPMRTVSDLLQPPLTVATSDAIPASADSGWLLGLTAKNVTLARIRTETGDREEADLSTDGEPATDDQTRTADDCNSAADAVPQESQPVRLILLLEETEGLSASCGIRTLRKVRSARLRRPDGRDIRELPVGEDGVVVEFSAFQIREVELTF